MKPLWQRLYEHALTWGRIMEERPAYHDPGLIRDLKEAARILMPPPRIDLPPPRIDHIHDAFRLGRMSPIEAVEALKELGIDHDEAESMVNEWIDLLEEQHHD